jgi:hypothetical protein
METIYAFKDDFKHIQHGSNKAILKAMNNSTKKSGTRVPARVGAGVVRSRVGTLASPLAGTSIWSLVFSGTVMNNIKERITRYVSTN